MAKRNPPDATRAEVKRADDKLADVDEKILARLADLEKRLTKAEARIAGLEAKVG